MKLKLLVYSVTYVSVSILPLIIIRYRRKRHDKIIRCKVVDKYDYKSMFFSVNNRSCKFHIYKSRPCAPTCTYYDLRYIIEFIKMTEHTLNLCMCLLTSNEIQEALVFAHHQGVRVRFITDKIMSENLASRVEYLKSAGITVKTQEDTGQLVHHKFCYCDENYSKKRKMFFGSLNLTMQGITSNWDALVFTNNMYLISQYKEHFERLWSITKEVS